MRQDVQDQGIPEATQELRMWRGTDSQVSTLSAQMQVQVRFAQTHEPEAYGFQRDVANEQLREFGGERQRERDTDLLLMHSTVAHRKF